MKEFLLILSFIYVFYLFFEMELLKRDRKSIKYVIHVNGIRGKSTVSRLLDSGLRAGGFKVMTKVTGTSPRILLPNGEEEEIRRWGKANIREQIRIFRRARKESAEILILECMAVKPELQKICEDKIVRGDISIITNVREDHLDEMGETLEDIAKSLSSTIPTKGVFATSDKKFWNFFREVAELKETLTLPLEPIKTEYEKIDFPENIALALNICRYLGIEDSVALEGMKGYRRDPGVLKTIRYSGEDGGELYFVNAMAANDPNSTEMILERMRKKPYWNGNRYLMINNRADRITRWEQYTDFIAKYNHEFHEILIAGESRKLFEKSILKKGVLKDRIRWIENGSCLENLSGNGMVFAVGNIGGAGREIVSYLERIGETDE